MPNAKSCLKSRRSWASLTEKLQARAAYIVDYKGITVAEDTSLAPSAARTKSIMPSSEYLLRFAFNNVDSMTLDDSSTAPRYCRRERSVAPARVIADYAKKLNGKLRSRAAFMEARFVDMATINALAAIPALPVCMAQVLAHARAPSPACLRPQADR